jgi:hypothetical protein
MGAGLCRAARMGARRRAVHPARKGATRAARVEPGRRGLPAAEPVPDTPAAPAVPRVPIAEVPGRALALAQAIEGARGTWGRAERIICMAIPREAGAAASPPGAALREPYASVLREFDRVSRSGAVPSPWRAVARGDVRALLTTAIGTEFAYGHQYVPEPTAASLADELLALFDSEARFFTVPADVRRSRANFDGGLLAIDDHNVGLLWFESDSPGR